MGKLGWFMSKNKPQHPHHVKVSPWGPTKKKKKNVYKCKQQIPLPFGSKAKSIQYSILCRIDHDNNWGSFFFFLVLAAINTAKRSLPSNKLLVLQFTRLASHCHCYQTTRPWSLLTLQRIRKIRTGISVNTCGRSIIVFWTFKRGCNNE